MRPQGVLARFHGESAGEVAEINEEESRRTMGGRGVHEQPNETTEKSEEPYTKEGRSAEFAPMQSDIKRGRYEIRTHSYSVIFIVTPSAACPSVC